MSELTADGQIVGVSTPGVGSLYVLRASGFTSPKRACGSGKGDVRHLDLLAPSRR
jgi:hypothetical protein